MGWPRCAVKHFTTGLPSAHERGILGIFQNYQGRPSDAEMMRAQTGVAELAEPLGFDPGALRLVQGPKEEFTAPEHG